MKKSRFDKTISIKTYQNQIDDLMDISSELNIKKCDLIREAIACGINFYRKEINDNRQVLHKNNN